MKLHAVRVQQAADCVVDHSCDHSCKGASAIAALGFCHAAGSIGLDVQVRLMLLAALSGEHILFIGPPGTAKSELGRRLSRLYNGPFFERLLTRFSVPEVSFRKRLCLPWVHVVPFCIQLAIFQAVRFVHPNRGATGLEPAVDPQRLSSACVIFKPFEHIA